MLGGNYPTPIHLQADLVSGTRGRSIGLGLTMHTGDASIENPARVLSRVLVITGILFPDGGIRYIVPQEFFRIECHILAGPFDLGDHLPISPIMLALYHPGKEFIITLAGFFELV